jgi:hypothetical protein
VQVRKVVIGLIGLSLVVTGVLVVTARAGRFRPDNSGYSAIIWLPHGYTRAQARLTRAECSHVTGASSASGIARSRSAQTKGELVFSIDMRWAPDDVRSDPLLGCLNHNRSIDHYAIPL